VYHDRRSENAAISRYQKESDDMAPKVTVYSNVG
jgi:hypothetical protein